MPESPEELYARVVAQVGADGRLPMPPVQDWDTFPWDGDLVAKVLTPPTEAEPPRWGESEDKPCWCAKGDLPETAIWRNDRWTVSTPPRPGGLPMIVFLQSREHLDYPDLDDDRAGELGRISVWLHRIMERMPHIGRVHVGRWGDGSAHLHLWFIARPERLPLVHGGFAIEWDEMLPPPPEDVWRADLAHVARHLATHDGVALV